MVYSRYTIQLWFTQDINTSMVYSRYKIQLWFTEDIKYNYGLLKI